MVPIGGLTYSHGFAIFEYMIYACLSGTKIPITHIDFHGEIIKHRHLVENYNRVVMMIEQEKTKAAIDTLE